MKPEAQRISIAEALGFKLYSEKRGEYLLQYCLKPGGKEPWMNVQLHVREEARKRYKMLSWSEFEPNRFDGWSIIPDYLNDLNAMHEAEKRLLGNDRYETYPVHLRIKIGRDIEAKTGAGGVAGLMIVESAIFATAAQRAEAFLKTLNLWKDES